MKIIMRPGDCAHSGMPLCPGQHGKPFPEGSVIVKIEWSKKKNPESPYSVVVPDTDVSGCSVSI